MLRDLNFDERIRHDDFLVQTLVIKKLFFLSLLFDRLLSGSELVEGDSVVLSRDFDDVG